MWSRNFAMDSNNSIFKDNYQFNNMPDNNFDLRKSQFEHFKMFMGRLFQTVYNSNQTLKPNELERIYKRFTHVTLDCDFFPCIMSSLVNYYLLTCNLRSQRYLHITEKENMLNFIPTFRKSLFSKLPRNMFCKIPEINLNNSRAKLGELSIDKSVHIYVDNIKAVVKEQPKMCLMQQNLTNDNKFREFAAILDQDYTKSSKGYRRKYISQLEDVVDDDNSNFDCYDLSFKIQYDESREGCFFSKSDAVINKFSQIFSDSLFDSQINHTKEDSSDSDDHNVSSSDEGDYDCIDPVYNNVISRYFNTLECSHNKAEQDDSSSDDSILFSEDPSNIKTEHYDSDNDDSIFFSEDPNNVKTGHYDSDSDDSIIFSKDPNSVKTEYYDSDSDDSVTFSETPGSMNNNNFTIFCDEDQSSVSFVFTNKSVNKGTYCLNSNEYMSYPDLAQQDSSSSDGESNKCVSVYQIGYGISSSACSLSQDKVFISRVQSNFSSQGIENPCFKDNTKSLLYGFLKMVNDNWKIMMADVPDEPRMPKKVSFVSEPTVQIFEREEHDGPTFSQIILDKMRFKNRIEQFESMMAPFLMTEHRTTIIQRNNAQRG